MTGKTMRQEIVSRIERTAPFLARQAERFPDLIVDFVENGVGGITSALAPDLSNLSAEDTRQGLRIARHRLALALALGDVSGELDFDQVSARLSDFADASLDAAIIAAFAEYVPDEEARGFAVIALGKHGGRELNYSSDIDPIFLFDPATMPKRGRDEPQQAAVRIGRKVIELLQDRDADGYVFRVDMRLRPTPEVSPIVLPVNGAISYYESAALAWERAAFVRARACAGDRVLGAHFMATIQPFVWRRSLDFGAIDELKAMTAQIRSHHAQGHDLGPGFNLKHGHGGIREVEFFTQAHQLIHGGRDPALRTGNTLDALAALSKAGRIPADQAQDLAAHYRTLRTIEHRLQMIDDRQTHALPEQAEELAQVAQLHGVADGDSLIDLLAEPTRRVAEIFDTLGTDTKEIVPHDDVALLSYLAEAGFAEPDQAARRLEDWRAGKYPSVQSPAARTALDQLLPELLKAFGASADPMTALNRFDTMVSRLPSAVNLFRLLHARPAFLTLLGHIMSHAPTLAEMLGRRPQLLDGLIDATAFAPMPEAELIAERLRREIAGLDYETALDRVRDLVGELRFAIGMQLVSGSADPVECAGGYARVADAAIEVLARLTIDLFAERHGRVPESDMVMIALGRLGGSALTHASDLDIIFVFTGDYSAESDGEAPLGAVTYFNRLAQRIIAALSVPTAAGALYEVDTRLRPSGAQGPLTVSLDAFERYQREDAWTWEHMALTRARIVYGEAAARAAVQSVIDAELAHVRDPETILTDAQKMRADMDQHKPPKGPLDVKLSYGGLVDLEFAVHVAQLTQLTGFDPNLETAIDLLARQGQLSVDMAADDRLLTRLLVALRLMAPDSAEPPEATRALLAKICGCEDWAALLVSLTAARQRVADEFARILGVERLIDG